MTKRLAIILSLFSVFLSAHAQEPIPDTKLGAVLDTIQVSIQDSIQETVKDTTQEAVLDTIQGVVSVSAKRPSWFSRTMSAFTNFFMGCDTTYVTPQKYQFTTQAEVAWWNDYCTIQSPMSDGVISLASDPSLVVGGYVYYSIIGYGYSWNMLDIGKPKERTNGTGMRQSLCIHTAKFFAEGFIYKSTPSTRIARLTGYDTKTETIKTEAFSTKLIGVQAFYIFNNKHYSWPAAFGENAVQRKSAGSFNLGFQINNQKISLDRDRLTPELKEHIDSTITFSDVNYTDYSVSVGYAYNFVPRRNLLLAISLQPSIGYRHLNTNYTTSESSSLSNLSTGLTTRASFFWNNTKYFAGLILEHHTYFSFRHDFNLLNTYGTLKLVIGLNFLKKK